MARLELARVMLLSGLANRRVYQFRHISERTFQPTGAPGLEPGISVLENDVLPLTPCSFALPACRHTYAGGRNRTYLQHAATTGLQSAADPFGLSGAVGHSHLQAVRQIEKAGAPRFALERPAHPKIPVVITVLEFLGSGNPLPRIQPCRLRRS